ESIELALHSLNTPSHFLGAYPLALSSVHYSYLRVTLLFSGSTKGGPLHCQAPPRVYTEVTAYLLGSATEVITRHPLEELKATGYTRCTAPTTPPCSSRALRPLDLNTSQACLDPWIT